MADTVTILVPGRPRPWQRPRVWRGRYLTPRGMRDYENLIAFHAAQAMRGRQPLEGPINLDLVARFRITRGKVSGDRYVGRPDLDNLIKNADALNRIVWRDDAQVVTIRAQKLYSSDAEGLLLRVTPLER